MFLNKKAAGDAISALILFIAVVGVSVGLVVAIKNYAFETQDNLRFQNEVVNNQLKTSIDITNIHYNSTGIYVYLKNTGSTKLVTEDFDFFINDAFISDFSVYDPSDLSTNLSLLLVSETAAFFKNITLSSGTHEVKLVSGYGGSGETDYFNN